MLLAVDVHYPTRSSAMAAGVLFEEWSTAEPSQEIHTWVSDIQDYVPGQFYRRELPCLMTLIRSLEIMPETIVIDGFVTLGSDRGPGLGHHLYHELDGAASVVGVAKRPFKDTPRETEVYRGSSRKPLFVTSIGMELERAKSRVRSMHGAHRVPTLLKSVDRLCRERARY